MEPIYRTIIVLASPLDLIISDMLYASDLVTRMLKVGLRDFTVCLWHKYSGSDDLKDYLLERLSLEGVIVRENIDCKMSLEDIYKTYDHVVMIGDIDPLFLEGFKDKKPTLHIQWRYKREEWYL